MTAVAVAVVLRKLPTEQFVYHKTISLRSNPVKWDVPISHCLLPSL